MNPRKAIIGLLALLPLWGAVHPAFPLSIDLLSPDTSGLVWSGANDILWTTDTVGWTTGDTVKLEWTTDGLAYNQFAKNLPYSLGTFRWHTTTLRNGNYKVKISKSEPPLTSIESASFFQLTNPVIGKAYFVNDTDLANDVYCSAIGSNFNNGTSPATPKWSIQSIISTYTLGPGDVVYVDTGRWVRVGTEATITSADKGSALSSLFFSGSPNGTVFSGNFMPGSANRIYVNGSPYLSLSYFTAEACLAAGIYAYGSSNIELSLNSLRQNYLGIDIRYSNNFVISKSEIKANTSGGIFGYSGSSCRLSGNEISLNGSTGASGGATLSLTNSLIDGNVIHGNYGRGVTISQSSNTAIKNNIVRSSTTDGIVVAQSSDTRISNNVTVYCQSYGVYLWQSSRSSIFNNFMYNRGCYVDTSSSGISIFNNIFLDAQAGTYCLNFSGTSPENQNTISDFNLLFPTAGAQAGYWKGARADLRSWVLNSGQDGHSISEDPLLADFAGGDYHPQSTEGSYHNGDWTADSNNSPCLNAGRVAAAFTELSQAVSPGAAIVRLVNAGDFLSPPDWFQIEGEFVSYTGKTGDTLTGCSGITASHPAGTEVFQPRGSSYTLESAPNGDRVNIGAYGNTSEASRSSLKSIIATSPWGGPEGREKWSREKDISWRTIGTGWSAPDKLEIAYSTDSLNWQVIATGVDYDSSPYPAWDTATFADSATTRVRVRHAMGEPASLSGIFVTDNTPPIVGADSPANGATGQPLNTALISRIADDSPAGLNPSPYYFQIDTVLTFDSPALQNSGWLISRVWYVNLEPATTYYWHVKARDDADPTNESAFFADTGTPGSYRQFRTAAVFHARDIESQTTGLRWMLNNSDLEPGDVIYVNPGSYLLSSPLIFSPGDQGSDETPVTIEGYNGEVVLNGNGAVINCLQITGDYFKIINFSCQSAIQSGILISGNHNTLEQGRSFNHGGDGIEVTEPGGDYTTIKNMLVFNNALAGIHLFSAYRCALENNTCTSNGTREVFLGDNPPDGSIYCTLSNNILWGKGAGRVSLYVENESQTGFSSNYNDLYATSGASIGYWNTLPRVTFSDWTQASFRDQSSLNANPLFVGGTNYRLQSTAGSYKPGLGWTNDGSNSPGIDAGDPLSDFYLEPAPNGARVNQGAYGNTLTASHSPSPASGTNYYVNDSLGDYDYFCSTSGLPWPGHTGASPDSPLDSIEAVFNHHTLKAGDTIYIDTGAYSLSSPIVPPVSGSEKKKLTFAGSPRGAFIDAAGAVPYCFYLQNKNHVAICDMILANASVNALYADNSSYIRFSNNQVTGCASDGVYLYNYANNSQIINNLIKANASSGIYGYRAYGSLTVRGNILSGNSGNGITVTYGENFDISSNKIESNAATGIRLVQTSGNLISNNIISNNGPTASGAESGIYLSEAYNSVVSGNTISGHRYGIENRTSGNRFFKNRIYGNTYGLYLCSSDNCATENNLIHGNQNWGIYCYVGSNPLIKNNTICRNGLYQIYVYQGTSGANIRNNIISAGGSGNYDIYVGDPYPDARRHEFDQNNFFIDGGAATGYWLGKRDTLWSWQTQSRQDGHSFEADPRFADEAAGDFHLLSQGGRFENGKWVNDGVVNSPCLNRGDAADDYSNELLPNGERINIGAYGDTDEASRSSLKTISITSPLGTAAGEEKWSRSHPVEWSVFGDTWAAGDKVKIEYTTNSVSFQEITSGISYLDSPYSSWNTLSAADGATYRLRLSILPPGGPDQWSTALSGLFTVDNTIPTNVGCYLPVDGSSREAFSSPLIAFDARDWPAGLDEYPYYFQIDTAPSFDSPNLQNSGWRPYKAWHPDLQPNTFYYWRVKVRDDADPHNESGFCGATDTPGTSHTFRTIGVYHALDIESETTGLRWILNNHDLTPGDIIYVDAGGYTLSSPLEFSPDDEGDGDNAVRITGYGGEVLLDGTGLENCLVVSGDYFRIENFSFTNATGSGVLITGDHNTLQGGRSFNNGGDGIEVTGDWTTIRNMLVYGNGEAGIHLFTSHHSTLENNTCSGNGTKEVFLEDEGVNAQHPVMPVGSTYCSLANNILDAGGAGRFSLYVGEISQTEFSSNYNNLNASGGAEVGYWNGSTQSAFSDWTGASFQDSNSLNANPLFVGGGDYHLQSTRGSYHGGAWSADTNASPCLDAGDPDAIYALERAPNGGRVNLGAYGDTVEASWSVGSTYGANYYVNDSSTEWDYFCSTTGLPWPLHHGMNPESPLDSIRAVMDNYTLIPGDTIYVDTGIYEITAIIQIPISGNQGNPLSFTGSPNGTVILAQGGISRCFDVQNRSYITLSNFTLLNALANGVFARYAHYLSLADNVTKGGSGDGFFLYYCESMNIRGNQASYNGGRGFSIALPSGYQGTAVSENTSYLNSGDGLYLTGGINSKITKCRLGNNSGSGIYVEGAYGTTIIEDNQADGNRGTAGIYLGGSTSLARGNSSRGNNIGLYLYASPNSKLLGNTAFTNAGTGFSCYQSNNAELIDNVSAGNAGYGYSIAQSPQSFLLNNTGYKNAGEAYIPYHASNIDVTVRNNVLWASGTGNHAIYFGGSNPESMGWLSSYNCLRTTDNAYTGYWKGNRSTLFDWKVASGQDGASIDYNPVFVDPAGGDFHIQSPLGSYHNGYWTADISSSSCLNQGQIYLASSYLASDIYPASTFIDLTDATFFSAGTDRIEVDEDIISYTGKTGNRLTGVTGIDKNHFAGERVFQPVGSDYLREPYPNGERIDIGAHGGTVEASLADRKTLPLLSPLGGEKWSGSHDLRWLAIPADEWTPGEPVRLDYSTDGFSYYFVIDTVYYPTQEYIGWNTLSAGGDSNSYQIRITGGGLTTLSGAFTIDNTPPVNVGCFLPENGYSGLPSYVPLRALLATDVLSGLNLQPYYFQVDTASTFNTPNLQNSGWLSLNAWHPPLEAGRTYYWRVKARDSADLPNESAFCGFTADSPGYGTFSTSAAYRAQGIDSATTGLRWILNNYDLAPGDTIYVNPGTYAITSPITITSADGGSSYFPMRIAGTGTGVLLNGNNAIGNCLILEGSNIILENVSFTGATGAGLLVAGDNNTIQGGKTYANGGAGIEVTGNANKVVNFATYSNGGDGIYLSETEGNRVINVTSHKNARDEVRCESSPHSSLLNNILWATAAGSHSIYVDAASQNGFSSEYNDLFTTPPALTGYWNGDRNALNEWRTASFQDQSSLSVDPLFASTATGDYHLKSQGGRWTGWITWTTVDTETSPGIDAGDPASSYFLESAPKGGRINLGAYGNTFQASRSYQAGQILSGINYYLNDGSTQDGVYTTAAGSDSNSGKAPNLPKRTLNGVLSIDLEPGDTVYVDTGSYILSSPALIYAIHSGSAADPVSFVGSPNLSLVDGNLITDVGLNISAAQYIAFEKLAIANTLGFGITAANARSISLFNSVVSWHGQTSVGEGSAGSGGGGINVSTSTNILLEGNRIGFNANYGVRFNQSTDVSIRNNLIRDNYGIFSLPYYPDSGLYCGNVSGFVIEDNICFRNSNGLYLVNAVNAKAARNTVYTNNYYGAFTQGTDLEITNNLIYDNAQEGLSVSGSGLNIRNNTLYRDRGGEFRTTSPNVNFRNNIAWAGGTGNYAVYFGNISGQFSDFNAILATGGASAGYWGGNRQTLLDWRMASGLDWHSLGEDPLFVDPDGADGILGGQGGADDDFHIQSMEGSYHFGLWNNDAADSPGLNAGSPYDPYYYETDPNGNRINIGAYGNTLQASRSSLDTLFLTSPYGGATGGEKWSGTHAVSWIAVGAGWVAGDLIDLEYTPDGSAFTELTSNLPYDSSPYLDWDTTVLADGAYYQVRVSDAGAPAVSSTSGRFIVDNTPPFNVGCRSPANGFPYANNRPTLRCLTARDALSGLSAQPYYFRLDTVPAFDSPARQTSGWITQTQWIPQSLANETWYYWQVKARDTADLPNESAFRGDTDTSGYWMFKTAAIFYVSDTQEFRDVLGIHTLNPGDVIYLEADGDFRVTGSPVIVGAAHSGTVDVPARIEGYGGRPTMEGDGLVSHLLDVQGYYILVQGIDFTNAGGSGLLISGDHNTVNGCQSYYQGGDGIEVTGDYNRIQNTIEYLNGGAGIRLNTAQRSEIYNNTMYDNTTAGLRLLASPNNDLKNNISWSVGTGEYSVYVDGSSQGGFASDWNDLYRTENALTGYWSGDRTSFGDWTQAAGQDRNGISADPKFYKIAYWGNEEYIYDFHLISHYYAYSPCIDRGTDGVAIPAVDYDAEPRWDDPLVVGPTIYDIGADEYVDTDIDLLPDVWEYQYFGHLGNGRQQDSDQDGIIGNPYTNIEEYDHYTNPNNPDTDFDHFSDGEEIQYGTNPLDPDTDNDGLLDGDEIYVYTNAPYSSLTCNPLDPDTDHDSYNANFNDGSEVAYWNAHSWARWYNDINYGGGNGLVNLLDPDSDGDGCPDGWEVFYGLDPADYGQFDINSGGVGDPDGDRLSNVEEYYFGTSPIDPNSPITRYIDRTAAGAGNGTSWANAFTTFGAALNWANATDVPVILLATNGVYYESNLEINRDRIALIGTYPRMPVLDGMNAGRGITITSVGVGKIDSLVIRNYRVNGHGAALSLSGSSPTLSNLVIFGNRCLGSGRGGAMYLAGNSSPLIADCTIVNNSGYNNYGGLYVSSGTPTIINTILWGNGDDLANVVWNQLFGCDIQNGDGIGFNGNISIQPNFYHLYSAPIDTQKYLHVNAASPAINAGHSWRTMLRDFEGDPRWNYLSVPATGLGIPGRNYYDMGTDEFVDLDYNTLPDWWEVRYFGATGQNPNLDQEPDGLINSLEYYYLTDPLKRDTDFDFLTDSNEVTYWNTAHDLQWPNSPNNPHRWDSDDDGDFLVNVLDADSDADTLLDGLEVYYYGSDPAAWDTDTDTLGDGEEVDYWNVQHNLLFPSSAHTRWDYDWDGDGKIALLDWDSDNDETPDGWEADNLFDPADDGFYFLVNGAGGDPDNDRVNNLMEYRFNTNPNASWSPQTVVVSRSGWANYTSITAALAAYNPQTSPPRAILVRPGVYYEKDIVVKEGVSLLGQYAADTIIDAAGGRGLIFNGITNALVDGFTIKNAYVDGQGAGILCYASSPFISNCVIAFNEATGATGFGGAIYLSNASYPAVVNCTIADNRGTDNRGGVYLAGDDNRIALINTILWSNGDELFGTQTGMARYCDIEDGDYIGINGNISVNPLFTNQSAGNYHIHWTSPLICAGTYPKAGGYDMDGVSRPQTLCPGPVILPPQQAFDIGAHEAIAQPSPTPTATASPTPTASPTTTPSPSPSPSRTPLPPRTPSPSPTPTPQPQPPQSPPPTPWGIPTASPTPEFPTSTPFGPTPSPTPFQIDFRYRDPARHSYLILHTPDTYYSIGWSSSAWQNISGLPDYTWYTAQWSYGPAPGQTWWSEWTYHETTTQYLQAYWTTPTPSVTPTPTITVTPTASPTPSPTPSYAYWYLAAGATQIRPGPWSTQTFEFEEYVQVTNPTTQTAPVEFTYLDETGPLHREDVLISPESRYTVKVNNKPGCAANDSISMLIYDQTDRIIMVERSMYWNPGGYTWGGGNNSVGNNTANLVWYLPEGATHVFDTFIHVVNPDPVNDALVRATFMNGNAETWTVETYLGPERNWTIYVNEVVGSQPEISTTIESLNNIPVAAERTMYWDTWEEKDPARYIEWVEGHASIGTPESATKWYIPEGATHIFDHFILIQNPSLTEAADIKVTFMDYLGKETVHYHTIPPHTRYTIWTNFILGSVRGFSAEVESLHGVPIFVEHATYWDAAGYHWAGGHGTIGLIHPAALWFLPEGATTIFDEYLLIANPNQTDAARVKITFMGEFGVQTEVWRSVPPRTRYTLRVNDILISSSISSKVAETENRIPIVVERAMYWDSPPTGGVHWKAGHSTIGIGVRQKLPTKMIKQ